MIPRLRPSSHYRSSLLHTVYSRTGLASAAAPRDAAEMNSDPSTLIPPISVEKVRTDTEGALALLYIDFMSQDGYDEDDASCDMRCMYVSLRSLQ